MSESSVEVVGKGWTAGDIPNQSGRRVLITGANSGIGYMAALELARKGAHVLVGCRDRSRGEAAIARMRLAAPGARIEMALLDLASLASIRQFADEETALRLPLDLLIHNAGVMAPKKRKETEDRFELQFGTNVLGHFSLTARLMPALERAAAKAAQPPRVVTLASIAHKRGRINFDDLQSLKAYSPMGAYQQSKLADLMFAFELDRRLRASRPPIDRILSVAAHPGVANTNLFQVGDFSGVERSARRILGAGIGAFLNTDEQGAVPTLFAATAPAAQSGGYYGPQGFQEMRGGDVGRAQVAPQAADRAAAARLWSECERLTGLSLL